MNIYDDGYIILKNILSQRQLEQGLQSDKNNVIDYKLMRQFIDNDILPVIISNTNFITKPKYIKFRYSNNNNSTDASTFHSDIYNFTEDNIMPVYTCLCYFDKTQIIVIPGSHKKSFHRENTTISSYEKQRVITIGPTDIMIFHANLYHRGTNFHTNGNRRLLQVFEIFPDDNTFLLYYERFITVITSNSMTTRISNPISYYLSRITLLPDKLWFIHYWFVYHNIQYSVACNDVLPHYKNGKLLTYEPGKRIIYDYITGSDPINVNIICENTKSVVPDVYSSMFYLLCWLILFVICYYGVKRLYLYVYYFVAFGPTNKNNSDLRKY
jgi:hypothetical protein